MASASSAASMPVSLRITCLPSTSSRRSRASMPWPFPSHRRQRAWWRSSRRTDGATLAVNMRLEKAIIYARDGETWQETFRAPAPLRGGWAHFGRALALSADGSTLAVAAVSGSGARALTGSHEFDVPAGNVVRFRHAADIWQPGVTLAPEGRHETRCWTRSVDESHPVQRTVACENIAFGKRLSLSGDGTLLRIESWKSAPADASRDAATGVVSIYR